ncbi:hypothetical protein niasHT_015737 [Heterodera trifolii]|uniref:Uncharacterized protein n=1 Tax=Heterodera trifolii TaxID=157864 RepID=A0ABD2L4V6_9BILA
MDNWKEQLKKRWKESAVFQRKSEAKCSAEGKLHYAEQRLTIAQLADFFPLARIDANELPSSRGISHDEARLRLADKHRQRRSHRVRVALRFLRQCALSAFPLLLLCSSLFCLAIALIDPSAFQNALPMALFQGVILAFVCTVGAFERSRLRRLGNIFRRGGDQLHAVVREGVRVEVPEKDILSGDLLWVGAGQTVPVDLRILWLQHDFRASTVWLTGNAEPTRFTAHAAPRNADLFTVRNILLAQFACTSGECLGLVIRTGKNTLYSRLLSLKSFFPRCHSPERPTDGSECQRQRHESALRRSYRSLVRAVVWLSLGLSTGALLLSLLLTDFARPFHSFVHVFLLFLIASVPQALPLTLGAQLLLVARRLRQKCGGMLLRQAGVADALGRTSLLMVHSPFVLCSNCPTVSDLWLAAQNKTINAAKMAGDGKTPRERAEDEMLRTIELSTKKEMPSGKAQECATKGHPTERALAKFLCQIQSPKSFGLFPLRENECPENILQSVERHPSLNLVVSKRETPPKNSNNDANETLAFCHRKAANRRRSYRLILRGPAEEVVKMCTTVGGEEQKCEPMDEQHLAQFEDAFLALSSQAKSCIGFAILDILDDDFDFLPAFLCESFSERSSIGSNSNGWSFLGMVALANHIGANCSAQLAELAAGGVQFVLLTDEHPIVAEAMAEQLGVVGPKGDEGVKISAIQMPLELQFDGRGTIFGTKGIRKNNSFSSSSGYYSSERGDIENMTKMGEDKRESADCDFVQSALVHLPSVGAARFSLFPRLSPSQTLSLIKELQLIGHSVTFVGDDPLRDAPALRLADVGIARQNGSSLLQEASDVLCANFELGNLLRAISECHLVTVNLASALAFSLSFTLPVLLSVVLPFSPAMPPLHTLSASLLVQLPLAFAMAFQRPIGPLQTHKKRMRPLVPRGLLLYVYLLASPLFAFSALLAYFAVFWHSVGFTVLSAPIPWNDTSTNVPLASAGISPLVRHSLPVGQARAAWLLTLVLSQLVHAWVCVGFLRRNGKGGKIFLNWPLWTAILLELSVLVLFIYVPGLNFCFGTQSPPHWVWLFPVGTVLCLLAVITLFKIAVKLTQRVNRTFASRLSSVFDW